MAENTIDNLSIQVTASAENAARVFDRLASSAGRLRGAAQGAAGGMRDMADAAKDVGTATQKAGQQSGEAEKKIRGTGKAAKETGDDAKKGVNGLSIFWNAMKRVGSITFKGINGALYDLPRYFGGKLIGNVRQAVSGIDQFFSSVKRIAFYRAIRTALKMITQGFAEGTKNLYEWSAALNGSFAASMDKIATSALYLKNSLGAMASPLIEAVAPAIDFVVDKFVDMFNIVNQIIAQLTGKTSYTAAKKVASQWQDASKNASGSAKKAADDIKRTILGFDEINKLNAPNTGNGSGSGNGNSAAIKATDMFEKRSISSWITDMVNSGDYGILGNAIADKINKALDGINWDNIKARAWHITDFITSLINGFIDRIDPNTLGKTLAKAINTAASTIDRFWSTVQWEKAGKKLRKMIVSFFQEIDVEKAADALIGKFRSIVTLISNAIPSTPAEWNLIGTKISRFINRAIINIPWSDIGITIGNLLVGAMTTMSILAKEGTLANIANGIKTSIQKACEKITAADVQKWISAVLKDVLNAINILLSIEFKIGDMKLNPLSVITFGVLTKSLLGSMIKGVFGGAAGGLVSGTKGLAFAGAVALLVDMGVQIGDVVDKIKQGKQVKASDITGILRDGLIAAGLVVGTKNIAAGAILITAGIVIEPVVQEVTSIVNDIKKNGITFDTFKRIMSDALIGLGTSLLFVNPAVGALAIGIGVILKFKILDTVWDSAKNIAKSIAEGAERAFGGGPVVDDSQYTISLSDPSASMASGRGFGGGMAAAGVGRNSALNTSSIDQYVEKVKGKIAEIPSSTYESMLHFRKILQDGEKDALTVSFQPVGENVTRSLTNGINQTWYEATNSINNNMNSLNRTADSVSFANVGTGVDADIRTGMINGLPDANGAMQYVANSMRTTGSNVSFNSVGSGIVSMINSGVNANSWSATSTASALVSSMYKSANGVSFNSIGSNIISGIYSGLTDGWDWLTRAVRNLANNLFNTAKRALGIASPSKVFEEGIGKNIDLGISKGIMNSMPDALSSVSKLSKAVASEFSAYDIQASVSAMTQYGASYSPALSAYSQMDSVGVEDNANDRAMVEILRDVRRLLVELNAKDTTVEIPVGQINRANSRLNRRSGVTVAPVTT